MRRELDADRVHRLLAELGRRARGPGRVYLTGGTTAVLEGWRLSTVDADLKLDPEPAGAFEAIGKLQDLLSANVELASPEDFIPALPGWRERSSFIARHGEVDFFHYDYYAQALSKIERGHERDLGDVREMVGRDLIEPEKLRRLFHAIEGDLPRYPAIDPAVFEKKLQTFLKELENA